MRHTPIGFAVLLLGALSPAQGFSISPPQYERHEGNSYDTHPFHGASGLHYQEAHGDLRNSVLVLRGIGWRRDGLEVSTSSYGPRTIDAEISIGDGDLATF